MPPFHEIYQVDAFADRAFTGNPAAICPLVYPPGVEPTQMDWPAERVMQAMALENNLSETAYFKPSAQANADYDLRWFTPATEAKLCGHATLASAYVLYEHLGCKLPEIRFSTLSGILKVRRGDAGMFRLDFPADRLSEPMGDSPALEQALGGARPLEIRHCARGILFARLERAEQVRALQPDFAAMARLDQSVLVTAEGAPGAKDGLGADFVSRYFAPHKGVPEDPVTGSAHCALTPYWSERLGRAKLKARQLSSRGGSLECELAGGRVWISGRAALFFRGTLAPGLATSLDRSLRF
jgi:PhzF family phenazine biosynthesis protein